jgi:hypothetical protein
MFGISALTAAVRHLADNLLALASTVNEVNAGLRQRLALDGTAAEGPFLTHQTHQDGTEATPAADGPDGRSRRGRRATA